MKYRLISIWDLSSNNINNVVLEVCLNIGKKKISPFQRKVNIFDLIKDMDNSYDFLLNALAGTGQINQPFSFTYKQLDNQLLNSLLNLTNIFINKGSSLKPIDKHVISYKVKTSEELKIGKIESAELTIDDLKVWWKNIRVNFRYEDCLNLIPATIKTPIPFLNKNNILSQRNYSEENIFISNLYGILNNRFSLLSLDKADTISLKECIWAGWQVFYKKNSKQSVKLKIIPNKYGIDWFSSKDSNTILDTQIADQLLQNFLKEDNYYQSNDGEINFFNNHQIKNIPQEVIVEAVNPDSNIESIFSQIKRLEKNEVVSLKQIIKKDIKANLMDFQYEGVIWLTEMRNHGTGCLLADDMGLGKTLQTISYLSTRPLECFFLVVVPTSLIDNWHEEIKKFAPHLLNRITVISYDLLRINPHLYAKRTYDTLIIDEGQFVKNFYTQRHKSFNNIIRKHTIMLTGTPIENGIHEIWSQFDILIPGIKSIYDKINNLFSSIQQERIVEISRLLLSPFILRRTKDEVFNSFPEKNINNIYIYLNNKERSIYDNIRQIIIRAIERGITGRVNSLALTGLLRLRQACVCPQILPQQFRYYNIKISSKFVKALEIIFNKISNGHKVLVFSQFTSVLERFQMELNKHNIDSYFLSGSTKNRIELVNNFNNFEDIKVFLISLKAGGTGLNLTVADQVILLDNWWNPAVEEQAFARSHRIGQKHNVQIYRLICKDTVEEKILKLQEKKKNVSDMFNASNNNLTIEDIKNLIF